MTILKIKKIIKENRQTNENKFVCRYGISDIKFTRRQTYKKKKILDERCQYTYYLALKRVTEPIVSDTRVFEGHLHW